MQRAKTDKIGDAIVTGLSAESLDLIGETAGSTDCVAYSTGDSLNCNPSDPSMAAVLEAGEAVMDENKNLLQGLR
jgi:hypothetical protein